jgi:hypothetical protein
VVWTNCSWQVRQPRASRFASVLLGGDMAMPPGAGGLRPRNLAVLLNRYRDLYVDDRPAST